jgi:aspartate ammonia-lyase
MEIPADAYWGIHTARALENFPISMRRSPSTATS